MNQVSIEKLSKDYETLDVEGVVCRVSGQFCEVGVEPNDFDVTQTGYVDVGHNWARTRELFGKLVKVRLRRDKAGLRTWKTPLLLAVWGHTVGFEHGWIDIWDWEAKDGG